MKTRTKIAASRVENKLVQTVGKRIFVGSALFKAVRKEITEVGIICKEVALSTKNIALAYSACGELFKSRAP